MNPTVYTPPTEPVADAEPTEAELIELGNLLNPNPYQRTILFGLRRTSKHVYAGTVPAATIARRRAANRAARKTRQAQRRAA